MEEKKPTGYPSIDKPWLKYYSEEAIQRKLAPNTIYGHLWDSNKEHLDDIALVYFEKKITYRELFGKVEQCARSLTALGVKAGDVVTIQTLAIPQTVVLFYALSRIGAVANLIYVTYTQAEGIAAAKAKGIRFGRPPKPLPENFHSCYQRWKQAVLQRKSHPNNAYQKVHLLVMKP